MQMFKYLLMALLGLICFQAVSSRAAESDAQRKAREALRQKMEEIDKDAPRTPDTGAAPATPAPAIPEPSIAAPAPTTPAPAVSSPAPVVPVPVPPAPVVPEPSVPKSAPAPAPALPKPLLPPPASSARPLPPAVQMPSPRPIPPAAMKVPEPKAPEPIASDVQPYEPSAERKMAAPIRDTEALSKARDAVRQKIAELNGENLNEVGSAPATVAPAPAPKASPAPPPVASSPVESKPKPGKKKSVPAPKKTEPAVASTTAPPSPAPAPPSVPPPSAQSFAPAAEIAQPNVGARPIPPAEMKPVPRTRPVEPAPSFKATDEKSTAVTASSTVEPAGRPPLPSPTPSPEVAASSSSGSVDTAAAPLPNTPKKVKNQKAETAAQTTAANQSQARVSQQQKPVQRPKSGSRYSALEAPPLPITPEQKAKLDALLVRYEADQITPNEYHQERAKILANP